MRVIYDKAQRLTRESGVKHHVDHTVPLQSPLVCGLHCEFNLQVITEKENKKKHNRWWPENAQRQSKLFDAPQPKQIQEEMPV